MIYNMKKNKRSLVIYLFALICCKKFLAYTLLFIYRMDILYSKCLKHRT